MQKTTDLSEARRALLDKYLRGSLPQTAAPVSGIPRRTASGPAPLSFGQQQLWLLAQLMPDTPMYNESATLRITGALDVPVLEKSLNEFINRHEAWRTIFPIVDEQPAQVVQPAMPLQLPVIDLSNLPETQREGEALRLATENAIQPFDLAQGPLLRAILVHLNENDHRLYMTMHHIIFDAVAIYQIFLPELHKFYEAFSHGEASPLAPLTLQYADFAAWQREVQHKEAVAKELAYWKEQLAGIPQVLELPSDHPRPAVQRYQGSMQTFAFSRRLTDALKALSRQEGVTLYMTVTAAFQALLHRYTGQNDLVIGTVTSDRKRPEVQGLVGYFLNTLVLRTNMDGDPTFRELLGRVREVVLSARRHEDVPFEYVVKELHPERTLSYSPVVQVLLAYQPSLPELPANWSCSQMDVQTNTSKFDLSVEIEERADGLIGRFVYNTDLFEDATIVRMIGHMETLLEGIVAHPEQQIEKLPLLKEAERHTLLVDWNATQVAYPEDICLHQLIEGQVERTPQAIAVSFEQERLTYRELNKRANRLAHRLRELGVGPDVLVGVCMHRSLELVVGLLAILKAGGAYVPVDPDYPQDRIAFMLEDAQAPVLLTQSHLLGQFPASQAKVLCLDSDWPARCSAENLEREVQPHHLAYVIYTSGSTGKPKGAMNTHRAICNRLLWMQDEYHLTAQDRVLQKTPFSFDVSVWEFFWPLLTGAHLVMARPGGHRDPAYLAELLKTQEITTLHFVPSMLQVFLEEARHYSYPKLRRVICSGEALSAELQDRFFTCMQAELHNLYGPTEAAVDVTYWQCQKTPGQRIVPIGRPIANIQIHILDPLLQPVPIGVAGELHIGGIGLARGYLNRPELTAERFIPHPFTDELGARLYRTGDLVRYRSDGTIEHLGRLDFQVKLRGFRIELGEIETVLSQHFAVRQAVVVARENEPGDKRLVAYVVLRKEHTITENDLKDYMAKQVPTYMVPSVFVLLEMLPVTPNGKVDRRALPVPAFNKRVVKATFVVPTLPVHHQLTKIWQDLLGVQSIGIKDDFFDLGGHSLLAVLLMDRIAQVYGKKLPLSILFKEATIEHLATVLMESAEVNARAPLVAVQTGGSRRPFFYLHGEWNGGAFYSKELVRRLGPEQPFYLLEPYKFDGLPILPTFEAIAAAHLKSLRTVQQEGPYLLGGYCNGGLVAYELARQLRAQGQKVDLLVMIDSDAPIPARRRMLRRGINGFGNLLQLNQNKQFDLFLGMQHVYRYLRFAHYRFLKNSELMKNARSGKPVFKRNMLGFGEQSLKLKALFPRIQALRQEYLNIYDWVLLKYVPDLYPDRITFFWTYEELWRSTGWQEVVKAKKEEVEIHVVPGNHMTSRTEYLPILANHLCDCINKVQDDQEGIL